MTAFAALGNALLLIGAALISISTVSENNNKINPAVVNSVRKYTPHPTWLKQDSLESCDSIDGEISGVQCSDDPDDSESCECKTEIEEERERAGYDGGRESNVQTGNLRWIGEDCNVDSCTRTCRMRIPANRYKRAYCKDNYCTCLVKRLDFRHPLD